MTDKVLKISDLNKVISDQINDLESFEIEGEISEWKMYSGKMFYFKLKDDKSSIGAMTNVFQLENWKDFQDGMLVRAHIEIKFNQTKGALYAWVNEMVPHGEGALKIAFEKLRKRLEAEGLFTPERKRALPKYPEKIGLITSKDGAAINDFKKVLGSRMGGLKIYFYQVKVEGRDAIPDILSAFEYFNNFPEALDGIVLIRGGGSLENLQAFNDEKIARCVAGSRFPVLCGVGHEHDVTLCDLCADKRASTPSNAAELLVENKVYLISNVNKDLDSILNNIKLKLSKNHQSLDNILASIRQSIMIQVNQIKTLLQGIDSALSITKVRIAQTRQQIDSKLDMIAKKFAHQIEISRNSLSSATVLLNSLNPKNLMKMGYSVVKDNNQRIIKGSQQLEINSEINAFFYEGSARAQVTGKE